MLPDGDREGAFYVTFTHLLESVAKRGSKISEVFVADRTDVYPMRDEVMEIVANNMLAQCSANGRIGRIRKGSSVSTSGVQAADLLTGVVVAGHARRLAANAKLNEGKCRAIQRVSRVLGWRDLCFDTFPNAKFNIWHFPKEYRNNPRYRHHHCPVRRPPTNRHRKYHSALVRQASRNHNKDKLPSFPFPRDAYCRYRP
jgi:hypothetical protein